MLRHDQNNFVVLPVISLQNLEREKNALPIFVLWIGISSAKMLKLLKLRLKMLKLRLKYLEPLELGSTCPAMVEYLASW